MKTYYYRWQTFITTCRQINALLHCLNRQDELLRLIEWAEPKNLPGPCRAYNSRLNEEERRIFRYQVSVPHLMTFAHTLHALKVLICPSEPYYKTGYAAAYRRHNS